MRLKKAFLFFSLLVVGLLLSGCYGGEGASTEDQNSTNDSEKTELAQEINLTAGGDLATMNTLGAYDASAVVVMNSVFEGLNRIGPDNTIVPGIAESYELSEDNKTYTFKLREDAVWSDGTPVTAHDFVYSWRKAIHPDTAAYFGYLMLDIKNAAKIQNPDDELYGKAEELGIKAADDYTFVVELEYPVPYFIGLTATSVFFPQNKEFVEAQGENYALDVDSMIYNGPFVLDTWKQGEGWTMKKNETYWDADTVKLTTINQKIVKETSTAINLYETGEIDLVSLSSEYVEQYKNSKEYSTSEQPTIYFFRMNHANEYLKNENIRKAIDMGWNKQDMADLLLNNGSTPAYYLVPNGFVNGPDGKDFRESSGNYNVTDIEKAKEYWNKGLEELGVDRVTLDLLSYDGEMSKTLVEYIKNQLETNLPGLTIKINMQPSKQKLELEASVSFDLDYGGWAPDYQDPITFLEIFTSDSYYNQSNYKNEAYDELINKARQTQDQTERWNILIEAEKLLMESATIGPIYQVGLARLTKPYVKDLYRHPFGTDMSFKWAYIEE
ncbi:MAG: peptide ABC transporter substrate-binding protein [Bacillus sp. (in: firmicutes)]